MTIDSLPPFDDKDDNEVCECAIKFIKRQKDPLFENQLVGIKL